MPKTTLLRKQVTPTGSIQPHAGGTAPDGFLVCDGTIVNIADYPKLYAAIGTSWGYGLNDGLTFHLPDLRGRVLRGQDQGVGRDPDAASRTAANAGGNVGDNVGSVQGEATKKNGLTASTSSSTSGDASHSHSSDIYRYPFGGGSVGANRYLDVNTGNGVASISGGNHSHSVTSTTTINQGDAETRMINANVNYVIKAV
jgi:microcystin-dependent protein